VVDGDVKYLQVLRDAPLQDRAVIVAGYEELQAAMTSGAIPTPPLFGEPAREELLRLGSDPVDLGETALELAAHAQVLSRLRAVLRDYRRLCEGSGFAPPAITERMTIDPNDVRELEALGYM
jgi:regulator of sirC expression with transglutaminase-like and TPR domain